MIERTHNIGSHTFKGINYIEYQSILFKMFPVSLIIMCLIFILSVVTNKYFIFYSFIPLLIIFYISYDYSPSLFDFIGKYEGKIVVLAKKRSNIPLKLNGKWYVSVYVISVATNLDIRTDDNIFIVSKETLTKLRLQGSVVWGQKSETHDKRQ